MVAQLMRDRMGLFGVNSVSMMRPMIVISISAMGRVASTSEPVGRNENRYHLM